MGLVAKRNSDFCFFWDTLFYRHNSICAMSIWLWAISTIMSNGQYRRYGPQFPHFHNVHSCILRWDLSLYSWEGGSALISYVCSQHCIQPLLLPIDRQAAIPDGIKKKGNMQMLWPPSLVILPPFEKSNRNENICFRWCCNNDVDNIGNQSGNEYWWWQ